MTYYQQKNQGFTLPEMILVVAILGILLTMLFPDITRMMRFNDEKAQEANMVDIQRAVEARLKDFDAITADGGVPIQAQGASTEGNRGYVDDISPYANLPESLLDVDMWGNRYRYRRGIATKVYRDVNINVTYVALVSRGPDGVMDTTVPANLVTSGTNTTNYANLEAAGDDYLIKYTDYDYQVSIVDDALSKIKAIEARLDRFADARLSEYVSQKESWCNARVPGTYSDLLVCYDTAFAGNLRNENKLMFYPPDQFDSTNARLDLYGRQSGPVTNPTQAVFQKTFNTMSSVAAPGGPNQTADFIANSHSTNVNQRRFGMTRLMRIVGLPDDYCCTLTGEPLYYYSRPGTSGLDCQGSRPGISAPKKPPFISIERGCN